MSWKIKIRPADTWFSRYIRTRDNWTCQRCRRKYEPGSRGIENSHYHGRRKETTRFNTANCDAMCTGCHGYWHENPKEYERWKERQLGAEALHRLDMLAALHTKPDDETVILWCKAALKELEQSVQ